MKIIAHRGNIYGPNPTDENKPEYLDYALNKGFDVEIDIRYIDGLLYLGHDEPQYLITNDWLLKRIEKIWIHCKNYEALSYFSNISLGFNYFWHENDKYTITSLGICWGNIGSNAFHSSVMVLPEKTNRVIEPKDNESINLWAICTDYCQNMITKISM